MSISSRRLLSGLLLACAACSKNSPPAPAAPTPAPTPTKVIRLGGNLNFGDVLVGDVRTDGVLVINNDGNTALAVSGVTGPSSGVYTPNWTSGSIAPGASQTVGIRFAPTAEQSYNGTLTVAGDQTSGTNTIAVMGTGTRPPRRSTVTDPARDASSSGPGLTPPDLVGASVEVSGGMLTMTISFAPGTLSPSNIYCNVYLDTDENPATGSHGLFTDGRSDALLGAEFFLTFTPPGGSINRGTPGSPYVGPLTVTYPSADQARFTFPMSLLDNDDGRLAFRVYAHQFTGNNFVVLGLDFMPNLGLPPGVTR